MQDVEQWTTRKVLWRIIPFVFALYVVSYIDRANIGYAALQMNQELGLSGRAFGFAAGVFFIGYFLFQVPSNLALARFGARVCPAVPDGKYRLRYSNTLSIACLSTASSGPPPGTCANPWPTPE